VSQGARSDSVVGLQASKSALPVLPTPDLNARLEELERREQRLRLIMGGGGVQRR